MKDTVMQLVMLGLAGLSCYGYFRRAEKLFGLRPEFAAFISLSAIGLAMMLAAVLHVLQPAIYLVFGLGLALALYSALCRESIKDFLQPGIVFLLLCCAAFFVMLYGSRLTHVDNFSHWGAILKMIIQRGALPEHEPLVYFPAYPTGSSLLIYWFVRVVGIKAEWFWAYIQTVYLCSCVSVLFCFGSYKSRRAAVWSFAVTAAMALCLLCGNIDLVDLLVDTLIPLAALAATAICIYYRDTLSEKLIPLIIAAAFLPMIKNSGYLFSVVLIIFALCICKGRDRILLPLLMGISVLAMNRLWAWHVSRAFDGGMGSYHAMSAESLGSGFAEKTKADIMNITRAFFNALLHDGSLLRLALLVLGVIVLIYLCGRLGQLRGFVLGGFGVWLGWTVGMLAMYYTSMSVGEALRVAAFERYYASALVYCGGYFFILAQLGLRDMEVTGKRLLSFAAVFALCGLLVWPKFTYLAPQSMRSCYGYDVRCRFDSLVEQNNIPSGFNYIVFATEENEILARVLCTYLLQPGTTLVCTEEETEALGEAWRSYDYYIVLDENPENMAYVENVMGRSGAAGHVYG